MSNPLAPWFRLRRYGDYRGRGVACLLGTALLGRHGLRGTEVDARPIERMNMQQRSPLVSTNVGTVPPGVLLSSVGTVDWYSTKTQSACPRPTTHELVLYCIGCMYQQLRWYGTKDLRLICRLYNMKHGGAGDNPAPPTVDHNGTTQRGTTQRNASTRDSRLKNQGLESLNAARQLSS